MTNKRIIGKWGLFKIKKINLPLSSIQLIDTYALGGLEIDSQAKSYFFDFVGNGRKFKFSTIEQIKRLIDSADDEKALMKFSHSLQEKLEDYKLEESNPNMMHCSCCKELISRDSIYCVHCGKPVPENERTTDLFMNVLCFLLPPVGLILFLLNIGPYPKFAKQCLLASVFSIFLILAGALSLLSVL
ncbi:MAG: zinc ribbon domain-containing protein [Clostridia bacterium]|nr:zinc ribbon domain-containing protein [Clostridia bacterium]